jgi:transposase
VTSNFWTDAEKRLAITLIEKGHTTREVGEIVGRSQKAVYELIRRENRRGGIPEAVARAVLRPRTGDYWTDAETEQAARLFADGMFYKDIAKATNRTEKAVKAFLARVRRNNDPRFPHREPKLSRRKEPSNTVQPLDVRQACLAHWRDLDKHHPRGWPSLRIAPDYATPIMRPSGSHLSLVGSAAAMCENN